MSVYIASVTVSRLSRHQTRVSVYIASVAVSVDIRQRRRHYTLLTIASVAVSVITDQTDRCVGIHHVAASPQCVAASVSNYLSRHQIEASAYIASVGVSKVTFGRLRQVPAADGVSHESAYSSAQRPAPGPPSAPLPPRPPPPPPLTLIIL